MLSAGLKMKQQLGMRSNKVTDKVSDKLFKMGKNLEVSSNVSDPFSGCQFVNSSSGAYVMQNTMGVERV